MTTTIYFIRHAQSDSTVREDAIRPLTERGQEDSVELARVFKGRGIRRVYSSPYRRTVDTVQGLADECGLEIREVEGLRERRVGGWVEDFLAYAQEQWSDFTFKLEGGECLQEVQERNCVHFMPSLTTTKEARWRSERMARRSVQSFTTTTHPSAGKASAASSTGCPMCFACGLRDQPFWM